MEKEEMTQVNRGDDTPEEKLKYARLQTEGYQDESQDVRDIPSLDSKITVDTEVISEVHSLNIIYYPVYLSYAQNVGVSIQKWRAPLVRVWCRGGVWWIWL